MKCLKVEKLEGIYVFCIDQEKRYFAIEQNEVPDGLKPGDVLRIDDEGQITVEKNLKKK